MVFRCFKRALYQLDKRSIWCVRSNSVRKSGDNRDTSFVYNSLQDYQNRMTLSDNIDERLDLKSLFSLDKPLFERTPSLPHCLSLCHRPGLRGRLPRPAPGPPRGGRVRPEGGDQLDHGAPPRGDITAAAGLLDCTSVCTRRRNLFLRHCSLSDMTMLHPLVWELYWGQQTGVNLSV